MAESDNVRALLALWARWYTRLQDSGLGWGAESVCYRVYRFGPTGAATAAPCPRVDEIPNEVLMVDYAIAKLPIESRRLIFAKWIGVNDSGKRLKSFTDKNRARELRMGYRTWRTGVSHCLHRLSKELDGRCLTM